MLWEDQLMIFRSNPVTMPTTILWTDSASLLSISNQFDYLSTIPNFHKWCWDGVDPKVIRLEQRFPTSLRYFPASPRNKIIQAFCFRSDFGSIVHSCLLNILGLKEKVIYHDKKRRRINVCLIFFNILNRCT